MTDRTWSLSDPIDALLIGQIPAEFRDVRDQVASRLDIEHTAFIASVDGNDTDAGGLHKLGSARVYVQATAPVYAPDTGSGTGEGTMLLLDGSTDTGKDQNAASIGLGRLWIDSDTGALSYYDSTNAWVQVKLGGGVAGDAVVLLDGRSGGQTINGGTATTEGLTLKANAAADATGTILFEGANTAAMNFDSIPVSNLVFGSSPSGADTYTIKDLIAPTDAGDVLVKGFACITNTELTTTSGIARCAYGKGTGSDAADRTAEIGFAADLVIVTNDQEQDTWMWIREMGAYNKKLDDGVFTSSPRVTVGATTLTFPKNLSGGNNSGAIFYYFALKTNADQVDAV